MQAKHRLTIHEFAQLTGPVSKAADKLDKRVLISADKSPLVNANLIQIRPEEIEPYLAFMANIRAKSGLAFYSFQQQLWPHWKEAVTQAASRVGFSVTRPYVTVKQALSLKQPVLSALFTIANEDNGLYLHIGHHQTSWALSQFVFTSQLSPSRKIEVPAFPLTRPALSTQGVANALYCFFEDRRAQPT